jgi:hypothetical protein
MVVHTIAEACLSPRFAPAALILSALIVVACGSGAVPSPASPTDAPSSPTPTSSPTDGNLGDVDGVQEGRPELIVEGAGDQRLLISVTDPTAKAWRIVVTRRDTEDRMELIVESGDIVHGIRVDEIIDGEVVGSDELTHMPGDPTVAAGGCHPTVQVCWASYDISLPGPDGTLSVVLGFPDPTVQVSITGGSADWPGEPFILGPWRDSLPLNTWTS